MPKALTASPPPPVTHLQEAAHRRKHPSLHRSCHSHLWQTASRRRMFSLFPRSQHGCSHKKHIGTSECFMFLCRWRKIMTSHKKLAHRGVSQKRVPRNEWGRLTARKGREKDVMFFTSDAFWMFCYTQIVHCFSMKVGDRGPKTDFYWIIFSSTGNLCVEKQKATKIKKKLHLYPSRKADSLNISTIFLMIQNCWLACNLHYNHKYHIQSYSIILLFAMLVNNMIESYFISLWLELLSTWHINVAYLEHELNIMVAWYWSGSN